MIIGGGIAGITAFTMLNRVAGVPTENIEIYTDRLGGEYLSGGLKYLKMTSKSKKFVEMIYGTDYMIKKVVGAVLVDRRVFEYPSSLYFDDDLGNIQKKYWDKTRGKDSEFDERCMNNPWSKNSVTELKIIPNDPKGLEDLIGNLIRMIPESSIKYTTVDEHLLRELAGAGNKIIYTIPIFLLSKYLNTTLTVKNTNKELYLERFRIDNSHADKIWWDYLYVPDKKYPFHRVSLTNTIMDFEMNNADYSIREIERFMIDYVGDFFHKLNSSSFKIKGQIVQDVNMDNFANLLPKNILLLGRFAQFDKRVTWDKVIERMYRYINNGFSLEVPSLANEYVKDNWISHLK